jgi:hypothetical protein
MTKTAVSFSVDFLEAFHHAGSWKPVWVSSTGSVLVTKITKLSCRLRYIHKEAEYSVRHRRLGGPRTSRAYWPIEEDDVSSAEPGDALTNCDRGETLLCCTQL